MKIGVISDLNHTESPAYASYYYAVKNLHGDVALVQKKEDLRDIDILLCGNDHHAGHLQIWSDDNFTEEVNKKKIPFFVHTVEHIRSPSYPWNVDIQNKLKRYDTLNQRCWDIGDAKENNTKLARVLLSKNFQDFTSPINRIDGLVFVGKLYPNRVKTIEALSKYIKVDVAPRSSLDYKSFLSYLSSYKYVLSPISNGVNGIPGRFYESLVIGSIPVQEVFSDTLDHYTAEASIPGCVFFETAEECLDKLNQHAGTIPDKKMFLEEELEEFLNDFGVEVKL
jgi:hypothetical protein